MPFPEVCLKDEQARPQEWPTFKLQQNTCGEQEVVLHDSKDRPLVIDETTQRVCFIASDKPSYSELILNKDMEIVDAANGRVKLSVEAEDMHTRGLFLAQIVLIQIGDDNVDPVIPDKNLKLYKAYLEVDIDYLDMDNKVIGTSIAEIRLALRDLSGEDNFLLDEQEYTDTEIAWAMRQPVDIWNETSPIMRGKDYTPAKFPYRYQWIRAIKAELMHMAALSYLRDHLPYQAGGVTINDKNKYQEYLAISKGMLDEYKSWVLKEKRALNVNRAWGYRSLRSYGYGEHRRG